MQYTAKAHYTRSEYMGDSKNDTQYFTVEAESEEQAEEKIEAYFKSRGSAYSHSYYVNWVEFFIHLD